MAILADGWTRPDGRAKPSFQPVCANKDLLCDRSICEETYRLYGVLDKRLADRRFIAGEYSIADMATYPWIVPYEREGQRLHDLPHLKRWFEGIKARGAVVRAYDKAKEINTQPTVTEESKRILFGQTAATVGR